MNRIGTIFRSVNKFELFHRRNIRSVALAEDVFRPNDPTGDPERCLIIAHGLFGFRSNWRSLAKAICEKSKIQVVTVDMRNHGDSPFMNSMSYEEMGADLIETIEKHKKSKTILLGHSMGGKAAMMVGLEKSNLLKKLIVVDIAPTVSASVGEIPIFTRILLENLHRIQSEPNIVAARRVFDKILQESSESLRNNKSLRDFLLMLIGFDQTSGRFFWRANLEIIEEFMTEILHFPSKVENKSTNLETLFIAGGNSKYITEADFPTMKRLFPSYRLIKVENAGHWVHSERPRDFLNVVLPELNIS